MRSLLIFLIGAVAPPQLHVVSASPLGQVLLVDVLSAGVFSVNRIGIAHALAVSAQFIVKGNGARDIHESHGINHCPRNASRRERHSLPVDCAYQTAIIGSDVHAGIAHVFTPFHNV
jgi:hypothetical protein